MVGEGGGGGGFSHGSCMCVHLHEIVLYLYKIQATYTHTYTHKNDVACRHTHMHTHTYTCMHLYMYTNSCADQLSFLQVLHMTICRYYNKDKELPTDLKPQAMERNHGLRARCIRALYVLAPSLVAWVQPKGQILPCPQPCSLCST